MNQPTLLASLLIAAAVLPACASTTVPELGELPASFAGVLPCADCEGIAYHLDLFDDSSFFLRTTYLGHGGEGIFDDVGTWSLAGDSSRLALFGGREAPVLFQPVDANTLRKLDLEGRPVESELSHELERLDVFSPIEPRLQMRGMYRFMADAALFEECLTGRRFPVATEADNVALERGYRDSGTPPGEPVLVNLEGRLALRPRMEDDGEVWTLIPERFIGAWPGETCGSRMTTAELEDTYWKLTRVAGHAVMVGEGHREPHLVLRSRDGRLDGFGGCNRLMGTYELDGASIRFGPVASTMIACPQGEDTEHKLAIALELTRSWRIVGPHLELLDEHGEPTARFEARSME